MIVQCDKCGAKFHLADEKITEKGAKVRCSKCKAVFTVKKDQAEASSPGSPPPPAAARPAGPPTPKGPRIGGDDPFSDFNFSDDMDFGEGEDKIEVEAPAKPSAPPPPAPEPGFAAAPPTSGRRPPQPAAEESGGSDEGFDFSDEDFSLSDEPKAAPGKAKPAGAEFGNVEISNQPPPPPPPKGGPDDFGDFTFDDDSFSEKASAPAPGPPPKSDDEWGNVSFSEASAAPAKSGSHGKSDVEEAGFGDFQFDLDDHLPPAAGGGDEGMPAEDFVRSPTSRAPVRDDFEASIGDSESEPERREEARPVPPPPPKPMLKAEPRKAAKKGLGKPIFIVFIILAIPIGIVGYTNSQGWFTFDDLLHFRTDKIGPAIQEAKYHFGLAERPDTGIVEYVEGSAQVSQLTRPDGRFEVAVSGMVINHTRKTVQWIKSEVSLKDQNDQTVATGTSYCDVTFTDDELKTMPQVQIHDAADLHGGRNQQCINIGPGQSRPFTVVFFPQVEPGMKLTLSRPRVVDCQVLGNEQAPCPLTPPPGVNSSE